MLSQLDCCLFGLESIKGQYEIDANFKVVFENCKEGHSWNKFVMNDGYLFRANCLCILVGSVHLLLLQEAHGGGLMGHFGGKNTEEVLPTHFFLAKDEARHRTNCDSLHNMSKSYVLF